METTVDPNIAYGIDERHFIKVDWEIKHNPQEYKPNHYLVWADGQFPNFENKLPNKVPIISLDIKEMYGHKWIWDNEDCLGNGVNNSWIDVKAISRMVGNAANMYHLLQKIKAAIDNGERLPCSDIDNIIHEIETEV